MDPSKTTSTQYLIWIDTCYFITKQIMNDCHAFVNCKKMVVSSLKLVQVQNMYNSTSLKLVRVQNMYDIIKYNVNLTLTTVFNQLKSCSSEPASETFVSLEVNSRYTLEHLQLHNALQHWLHSMALHISKLFYLWLTPVDPCKLFNPINALHSGLGRVLSTNIWWPQDICKEFDLWLTLADPCMTFDPSNALRSGHGFFPPNLVAIGHC